MKPGPALVKDDNVTLDQYVRNLGALPRTIEMVNLWARVMHGLESTEESAAWFIDYCRRNCGLLAIRADDSTGGQYLRFQDGIADLTVEDMGWMQLTLFLRCTNNCQQARQSHRRKQYPSVVPGHLD